MPSKADTSTFAWNVWAMRGSQYSKRIWEFGFHPEDKVGLEDVEIVRGAARAKRVFTSIERGQEIAPEDFVSDWAWAQNHRAKSNESPSLTNLAGAYPMINQATKDLLESFDLGRTIFFPIKVWDYERQTQPWPEPLYIMNVCNLKDSVVLPVGGPQLPAFGGALEPAEDGITRYLIANPVHIKMTEAACDGPDIWIEQRILLGLFVSPRLRDALKAAGFSRAWALKKTLKLLRN